MTARLGFMNLLQIVIVVAGISVGQVLLKLGALQAADSSDWRSALHALANPWLIAGLMAFVASVALWMLVLRSTPLNIAYPFMALAFLLVPLLGKVFLGESLSVMQILGGAIIVLGVAVSTW